MVGIHGWAPGGTRFPTHFVVGTRSPCASPRLSSRSGLGVKIGGVHAATAAFFAAFCRALPPCGLRVGARAEMRYAAARREPNPASDPRSGYALAYARRSNPPDGGFPTPLVRPRLPRPFFGQNRSLLGLWRTRASILPKKRPSKALQAACNSSGSRRTTCLTAAYLPGADSGPRPAPSRPRGARRDWGRARWALRGMVSQSSRNN